MMKHFEDILIGITALTVFGTIAFFIMLIPPLEMTEYFRWAGFIIMGMMASWCLGGCIRMMWQLFLLWRENKAI